MELARIVMDNISIVSETEVLSYTYSGIATKEVLARVDLGNTANPIVGNGIYKLNIYIDTVMVMPTSSVEVPPGQTKAIMISRAIPLESGDVVSIKVIGLSGDASIDSITTLRDATPVTVSDVLGPGSVIVNHDFGSTDNLSYKTSGNVGIDNAIIQAYLKSDYDNGLTTASYIVAQTITNVLGRWTRNMVLDPEEYTLIYYKQGYYGPDRRDVTVS